MDKQISETAPGQLEVWFLFNPKMNFELPINTGVSGTEKVEVGKYVYGEDRKMRGRAVRYRLIPIEDPEFGKDTRSIDRRGNDIK